MKRGGKRAGAGRKPGSKGENTRTVTIPAWRATAAEKAEIKRRAVAANLNVSEYQRKMCLDGFDEKIS